MGSNLIGTIGGKSIIGTLGSGHIAMGKNVIPDWNQNDPQAEDYIKNRPGGYDIPPTVDISWDGDLTGKEKVQMAEGVYLVKIANEAPTFESFNADKAFLEVGIIYDGTTSSESGETTIRLDESGDAYAIGDIALGVSSDYFENEGMMFSKGLWFMWVGQAEKTKFVKRITSLDGAVKFPVKYMPNDITSGIREAQITASEAKTAATTAQETAEQAIGADVIKDNYVLRTGQPKYAGYGFAILYKDSSGAEEERAILSNQGVFIRGAAGLSVTSLTTDYLTIAGDVGNKSCIAANVNAMSSNNAYLVIKHSGVYTKLESDGVIRCPNYTLEIDGTSGDISNSGIILCSSTFGSNKKFKITVDDTGVPSFTDTGDATNKFTPVEDVQVAGTSVMTDGVANIPIANKVTNGVVRPDFYGIGVNSGGILYIQNTSNPNITNRVASAPLTAYNLDYAVKAAMCDGKGAAWTSAEQKAARERMGVDNAYELIEEITLAEESMVERSTEPDGTPYNFAVIMLRTEFPASEKKDNISIFYRIGNQSNTVRSYFLSPYNANAVKYGYSKVWLENGRYRSGWWSCAEAPGQYAQYYENPVLQDKYSTVDGNIIGFYTDVMVAGTKITIYGVRA